MRYRKKTATLFKTYFDKDTVGELLWTDNKIKLIGYIRLVDRYFGPQYNKMKSHWVKRQSVCATLLKIMLIQQVLKINGMIMSWDYAIVFFVVY